METKLTLRLDDALIRQAKVHAAKSGKSVSRLVSDFFAVLDDDYTSLKSARTATVPELAISAIPPVTRSLLGILPPADVDHKKAYRQHLDEKYL